MDDTHFIDHYENLKISSNADKETIERVFRLLAKRYHPDNKETGNSEKFDLITKAFNTLSKPEQRAAYDVKYEKEKTRYLQNFFGFSAPQSLNDDRHLRIAILSILYIERRNNPASSDIGIWRLEQLLGWPEKMLEFHIWYLKEKGWIQRTDTGGYAISVKGIDIIEEDNLVIDRNRLLPERPGETNKDEVEEEKLKLLKAKKMLG
jgi:curved DNA-binding protein CbpA